MNGLFCCFFRSCLYKGFLRGEILYNCKGLYNGNIVSVPNREYCLRRLDFQARVFAKIAVYFSCPKCLLPTEGFKLLSLLGREREQEQGTERQVACSKKL